MSVFRRRRSREAVEFDTGHRGDDELLSQIARHSDLDAPRHWVHYLYCADEPAARDAAEQIKSAGWVIQQCEPAAQGPGWVVVAEQHDAVTSPIAVREARALFEGIASRVNGGDYDGWEASV